MAVIDPATLDPRDPRPKFDKTHMPGGPWRDYRLIGSVSAVRVFGDFLIRRPSDGWLVERADKWVTVDLITGEPSLVDPDVFAAMYEVIE